MKSLKAKIIQKRFLYQKIYKISFLIIAFFCATSAKAEYCEDQFYKDVAKVNSEVSSLMLTNEDTQKRLIAIQAALGIYDTSFNNLLADKSISADQKVILLEKIQNDRNKVNIEQNTLITESNTRNKRIAALSTNASDEIKKKARECAQKIAPANLVVNVVVMGLAAYVNPAATVTLLANNPKALYIDMGEILNGNLMGGSKSAPNEVKKFINSVIGGLGVQL